MDKNKCVSPKQHVERRVHEFNVRYTMLLRGRQNVVRFTAEFVTYKL